MKLQFDDSSIICNHHNINKKCKTYDTFMKDYKKFTKDELEDILTVSLSQIKEHVLRCVPCIGCRTRFLFILMNFFDEFFSLSISIDNFIKSLIEYRHRAVEPLIINEQNLFTIKTCYITNPDYVYTLFYIYG